MEPPSPLQPAPAGLLPTWGAGGFAEPSSSPSSLTGQLRPFGRPACHCRKCRGDYRPQPALSRLADGNSAPCSTFPMCLDDAILNNLWKFVSGKTRPRVASASFFWYRFYEDHRSQGYSACDMSPMSTVGVEEWRGFYGDFPDDYADDDYDYRRTDTESTGSDDLTAEVVTEAGCMRHVVVVTVVAAVAGCDCCWCWRC